MWRALAGKMKLSEAGNELAGYLLRELEVAIAVLDLHFEERLVWLEVGTEAEQVVVVVVGAAVDYWRHATILIRYLVGSSVRIN